MNEIIDKIYYIVNTKLHFFFKFVCENIKTPIEINGREAVFAIFG